MTYYYASFIYFFKINLSYVYLIINDSNIPLFILFYFIFIFTNIVSLFSLSYLGIYGVFFLNLISLFFFWISLIFNFNNFFIDNSIINVNLGKWFILNLDFIVNFELFIDVISFSFMFLTVTIAFFVFIYAFSYFRNEPNVERLLLLINSFVISMVCLVISGNFFVMFLGWELIGLTSFFLINFWSTRMSTVKSAYKAFIFNKFSDCFFLISIIIVFACFNDINISSFLYNISNYNNFFLIILDFKLSVLEIISFFFLLCAFIKSAQFGFHSWLPDSMEAPVPASALIHSATLVSAGIYLFLRFSQMYEYSFISYLLVPFIGSFTAFFGGICSAYQSDIKKILAYSTISHCGFLMLIGSTYVTEYTILYLYIHGFFKAAVFLCVGNVIRFGRNYQDFRRMGGFYKYLSFECFATFICLINLCGLPFSVGFYIKHLIIIGVDFNYIYVYIIYINILGGAVSGLIYSYRLFYYVFFDFKKSKKIIYYQSNRLNLKSYFYSNTSLASNLSIFFLICVSYIISIYLFFIFLNQFFFFESLSNYSIKTSQTGEFNEHFLVLINNIGFFNYILVIFILIVLTLSNRYILNFYDILRFFNLIILFFILFLFFLYI